MGSGHEGEKGVSSGLHVIGIRVTRQRFREAYQLVTQPNTRPALAPFARRTYSVPWINSLWHIDGHHKLIRWKMVIHGGIDGFSRMVVFMRAADNNRAATVLSAFTEATTTYGIPSRVRADYGKENWDVKTMMEGYRGAFRMSSIDKSCHSCAFGAHRTAGHDRGSFIQGPSTRNQRIERLWVNLQAWCTLRFKDIFTHLEESALLDVDSPIDMFALHYCYLPALNAALDFFKDRWNRHGIRTAASNTPERIWLRSETNYE